MLATERRATPAPLTHLTDEEKMFQSTVRKFARERIAPQVREMDEAGVFRKDIIKDFFDLGLMAIDVPEQYGGQGGYFFQSILAIEELAKVDPSAAVIVDVQNTLFNNAILRWATEEQKRRFLPRLAKDVLASYALTEAGSGSDAFAMATRAVDAGRIGFGAQMTGLAQGALDHALAYAQQRKQFGKTISEFQGVQFDLAEMAVDVEAAGLMVYNAARLRDAGLPFVTEAAMAKYFASQIAERVASRAVEVLGGVGFTRDYPVEKLYRDAKIGRIYEGTSNMQRVTIAKQILAR